MRLGVDLPYYADPALIRSYAQAVEEMGYDHLSFNEHIVGADPDANPGVQLLHTHTEPWHEQLTLMAFLAGVTKRIELAPSMLLLPLRPAALVAKQAAEVDLFSGGRVRLEVSVSWNPLEYQALGVDFHSRGRIIEEQIAVLRALWTQETVTFRGRFHTLSGVGINPLPVQRPIPIWMGGGLPGTDGVPRETVLRRIARLADGYKTLTAVTLERLRDIVARLRAYARDYGRDPATIGVEARLRLNATPDDPAAERERWQAEIEALRALGVTHLNVILPPGRTRLGPDERLARFRDFKTFYDATYAAAPVQR